MADNLRSYPQLTNLTPREQDQIEWERQVASSGGGLPDYSTAGGMPDTLLPVGPTEQQRVELDDAQSQGVMQRGLHRAWEGGLGSSAGFLGAVENYAGNKLADAFDSNDTLRSTADALGLRTLGASLNNYAAKKKAEAQKYAGAAYEDSLREAIRTGHVGDWALSQMGSGTASIAQMALGGIGARALSSARYAPEVGAYLSSYLPQAGDNLERIRRENPGVSDGRALGYAAAAAVPQAAADVLPELAMAKWAVRPAVKAVNGTLGQIPKRTAQALAGGAAAEAATGGFQNVAEQAASQLAGGRQLNIDPGEVVDSAAAEAMGGAHIMGAGGALRGTSEALLGAGQRGLDAIPDEVSQGARRAGSAATRMAKEYGGKAVDAAARATEGARESASNIAGDIREAYNNAEGDRLDKAAVAAGVAPSAIQSEINRRSKKGETAGEQVAAETTPTTHDVNPFTSRISNLHDFLKSDADVYERATTMASAYDKAIKELSKTDPSAASQMRKDADQFLGEEPTHEGVNYYADKLNGYLRKLDYKSRDRSVLDKAFEGANEGGSQKFSFDTKAAARLWSETNSVPSHHDLTAAMLDATDSLRPVIGSNEDAQLVSSLSRFVGGFINARLKDHRDPKASYKRLYETVYKATGDAVVAGKVDEYVRNTVDPIFTAKGEDGKKSARNSARENVRTVSTAKSLRMLSPELRRNPDQVYELMHSYSVARDELNRLRESNPKKADAVEAQMMRHLHQYFGDRVGVAVQNMEAAISRYETKGESSSKQNKGRSGAAMDLSPDDVEVRDTQRRFEDSDEESLKQNLEGQEVIGLDADQTESANDESGNEDAFANKYDVLSNETPLSGWNNYEFREGAQYTATPKGGKRTAMASNPLQARKMELEQQFGGAGDVGHIRAIKWAKLEALRNGKDIDQLLQKPLNDVLGKAAAESEAHYDALAKDGLSFADVRELLTKLADIQKVYRDEGIGKQFDAVAQLRKMGMTEDQAGRINDIYWNNVHAKFAEKHTAGEFFERFPYSFPRVRNISVDHLGDTLDENDMIDAEVSADSMINGEGEPVYATDDMRLAAGIIRVTDKRSGDAIYLDVKRLFGEALNYGAKFNTEEGRTQSQMRDAFAAVFDALKKQGIYETSGELKKVLDLKPGIKLADDFMGMPVYTDDLKTVDRVSYTKDDMKGIVGKPPVSDAREAKTKGWVGTGDSAINIPALIKAHALKMGVSREYVNDMSGIASLNALYNGLRALRESGVKIPEMTLENYAGVKYRGDKALKEWHLIRLDSRLFADYKYSKSRLAAAGDRFAARDLQNLNEDDIMRDAKYIHDGGLLKPENYKTRSIAGYDSLLSVIEDQINKAKNGKNNGATVKASQKQAGAAEKVAGLEKQLEDFYKNGAPKFMVFELQRKIAEARKEYEATDSVTNDLYVRHVASQADIDLPSSGYLASMVRKNPELRDELNLDDIKEEGNRNRALHDLYLLRDYVIRQRETASLGHDKDMAVGRDQEYGAGDRPDFGKPEHFDYSGQPIEYQTKAPREINRFVDNKLNLFTGKLQQHMADANAGTKDSLRSMVRYASLPQIGAMYDLAVEAGATDVSTFIKGIAAQRNFNLDTRSTDGALNVSEFNPAPKFFSEVSKDANGAAVRISPDKNLGGALVHLYSEDGKTTYIGRVEDMDIPGEHTWGQLKKTADGWSVITENRGEVAYNGAQKESRPGRQNREFARPDQPTHKPGARDVVTSTSIGQQPGQKFEGGVLRSIKRTDRKGEVNGYHTIEVQDSEAKEWGPNQGPNAKSENDKVEKLEKGSPERQKLVAENAKTPGDRYKTKLAQMQAEAKQRKLNEKLGSKYSHDTGPSKDAMHQTDDDAKAIYERLLKGKAEITETDSKDFAARSTGEKNEAGKFLTELSIHARDPRSAAFHEALHDLLRVLRENKIDEEAYNTIRRALEMPWIRNQIYKGLGDLPNAKKMLEEAAKDPEEMMAYAFQLWNDGKLNLGAKADGFFNKVKDFFRNLFNLTSDVGRTENFFKEFANGGLAKKQFTPNAVSQALGKSATDKMLERAKKAVEPAIQLGKLIFESTPKRLMEMQNEHVDELTKLYTDRNTGWVWEHRRAARKFSVMVERELEGFDDAARDKALAELQAGNATSDAAKKLKQIIAAINKYAGRPEDEMKKVWSQEAINKDREQFEKDLKDYGLEIDDPKAVSSAALEILNGSDMFTFRDKEQTIRFKPEHADVEAKYLEKRFISYMGNLISTTTRKTEWNKIFDGGEKINELMAKAKAKGLTEVQRKQVRDAMDGWEGRLGANMSPTMRKFFSTMTVLNNLTYLPLMLFSIAIDPFTIAQRSGSLLDALPAYGAGLKGIGKTFGSLFGGPEERSDAQRLAEDIGAIEAGIVSESLGDAYIDDQMYGWQKRVNDWFFKWNMAEGWTRQMRVAAVESAMRFIADHGKEAKWGEADDRSARFMTELGLSKEDIPATMDYETVRNSEKLQRAINHFVDEAVIRPNESTNAQWMNDPRFMLLAHMKRYTFAFHELVMNRATDEALKHGNWGPMGILFASVPAILASDMVKEFIKPGNADWMNKMNLLDWWQYGTARAGLNGKWQFGFDFYQDIGKGKTGLGQLLGPTFSRFEDTGKLLKQGDPWQALMHNLPGRQLVGA